MNKAVEKQFIDCYEKEVDSVFRFFIMRTSQREIALDLVQETFLKYWQAMQKGGIGNERAYIFSIARNLLIDYWRKNKDRKEKRNLFLWKSGAKVKTDNDLIFQMKLFEIQKKPLAPKRYCKK